MSIVNSFWVRKAQANLERELQLRSMAVEEIPDAASSLAVYEDFINENGSSIPYGQTNGINSLDDLLHSTAYEYFRGDQDYFDDAERYARIMEYAEDGADGSTHYETIHDWYRLLDSLNDEIPELISERIADEIVAIETWHENNGSLHEIIG